MHTCRAARYCGAFPIELQLQNHLCMHASKMRSAKQPLVFCVSVLLLSCCRAQGQSTPQILLQGRFDGDVNQQTGLGSPPLVFSWPASSIYASFMGSAVNATLTTLTPSVASSQYTRFAFYLDQQQVAVEVTDPNNTSINWGATGLGNGTHNLTITKLSEASYGQATLESLTVGPGGSFVTPQLPSAFQTGRRIQFIGDSYTVGFGNIGGTTHCNATVCEIRRISGLCYPELDSENAAIAWGPLTAANFSADYQVIAWSGAGVDDYPAILPNGSHMYTPGEPAVDLLEITPEDPILFSRVIAADNTSMVMNYSSWVPQVVVMAGGTNDFHATPPPLEEWTSDIINFMNTINEEYDMPEIIIQVFPLEVQIQGVLTYNQTTTYLQYMSSLYTAAQAESMSNVHLLQLNGVNLPTDGWCVSHPSAAADANIAAQLSAYIEAVLPEWTSSTYPMSVTV